VAEIVPPKVAVLCVTAALVGVVTVGGDPSGTAVPLMMSEAAPETQMSAPLGLTQMAFKLEAPPVDWVVQELPSQCEANEPKSPIR
jgi:hypothetical protein